MTSARTPALMPRKKFLSHVRLHSAVAALVLLVNLGVGVLGYHVLENLAWVDAFANAALILSGMDPFSSRQDLHRSLCDLQRRGLPNDGRFLSDANRPRILHRLHLESGG